MKNLVYWSIDFYKELSEGVTYYILTIAELLWKHLTVRTTSQVYY